MGEEVEWLLGEDPPLHQEACHWMNRWYWAEVYYAPLASPVILEQITAECVNLYRHVPTLGENIPVSVYPFSVEYLVLTEEKIKWAVKRLQNYRFGATQGCGWST